MMQLLTTRFGAVDISLSYMIRDTFHDQEYTNIIPSLHDRITSTNMHSGNSFDIDNKELFCIPSNTLSGTTLEDVILSHQRTQNG